MQEFTRYKDTRTAANPLVTLVLCSYNQSTFVSDAINAADRVRSFVDAELLFIDDGSSDDSFNNAIRFLEASSNYFVVTKKNQGLVHSLNTALNLARGKLVIFIAVDDRLLAEGVVDACTRLNGEDRAVFFIANATYFGEKLKPYPVYSDTHYQFLQAASSLRTPVLPSSLPAPLLLQATVFRTDYLRSLGGWDSDVILDDLPLFLKMFSKISSSKLEFLYDLQITLCEYRQHGNNSSKKNLRLYGLYEQCILRYCDSSTHQFELANAIGIYVLNSIRQGNIKVVLILLKKAFSYRVVGLTVTLIFRRIYRKIKYKICAGDSRV